MEYVTAGGNCNEQLLYFTTNSLSEDDKTLFFLSDCDGQPNIWCMDLQTGAREMLSRNTDGVLKSYVYFRGRTNIGLGKASMALDSERGIVYYLQGPTIMSAAQGREPIKIATLPADQMTAFTHISADGRYLCVPTTDARALENESGLGLTSDGCGNLDFDIDERVRKEGLCSYLRVFDVQSGEQVLCEKVERAWITHVQFSPADHTQILYNHEWCADCGIRRMWLYKDGKHIRLRQPDALHLAADWACHEMWLPDGSGIVYHGGYKEGGFFVGLVDGDYSLTELRIPEKYSAYGHFTMGNAHPNWLVTDGYYRDERDKSGYICALNVDWASGKISWKPLCLHGSSWTTQDSHPHPIFDHADKYVYFTGQRNGRLTVCRAEVGKM